VEEKESDKLVDDGTMTRRFNEALDTVVASFPSEDHRRRIMRLAKYGVSYAFTLMYKLQADMLEEIAVLAARKAGIAERTAQHDLVQAAHSVVRPGTGMDARPPPEEKK